jgi:hypothetical protein
MDKLRTYVLVRGSVIEAVGVRERPAQCRDRSDENRNHAPHDFAAPDAADAVVGVPAAGRSKYFTS